MIPLTLEWAARALSLFDALALLWLGLTVLLNAERRDWGAWLAGAALCVGGLFFAIHLAFIDAGLLARLPIGLWWRLAWLAFVVAPANWGLVIAWYTFGPRLRGARLPLAVLGLLGLAALVLLATESLALE